MASSKKKKTSVDDYIVYKVKLRVKDSTQVHEQESGVKYVSLISVDINCIWNECICFLFVNEMDIILI